MPRSLEEYLALPYTVTSCIDEDGCTVLHITELPGCAAHGDTPALAEEALRETQVLWITACLECGYVVPEPRSACGGSGT